MKSINNALIALIVTLALPAVSFADLEDLSSDMIETETIMADSEAALLMAEETEKQLTHERAQEAQIRKQAQKQEQAALSAKKKADAQILANETKIKLARQRIQREKKRIADLQKAQAKKQQELEKSNGELVRNQSRRDQAMKIRGQEEQNLQKVVGKNKQVAAQSKKLADEMKKIEQTTKVLRLKLKKAYAQSRGDQAHHEKLIAHYRKILEGAHKHINELEVLIEVDQAYDQRLGQLTGKSIHPKQRTLSGLNLITLAQVKKSNCALRAYPVGHSQILGRYNTGEGVKVSKHNSAWYATVYRGEKAFVEQSCFQ
ncbi:MAG: hypothetical protein KDD33_10470 [Bdellovibrionales bacterium]|nr:hypothetical protein [Bdellovibrionales bacterium]